MKLFELREYKSDFLKTIAVYLTLNGNLKESAAFLHIHTNTLKYRLNRIAEITGKSLKETDYRTSIYLEILTEETAQVNGWFQEAWMIFFFHLLTACWLILNCLATSASLYPFR
ncbi:hypothetical protein R50912_01350 [Paenibacillus sp. FSL R5-0912]|uniref:PucR family transcriptional regulator n=1 Tax=Paenibacillus sp. FSL R5-0912 TaxID=1536771 RepID=UPI0004F77549|nr:helix-turn-helix domain-containing protein [Paenibacillus sp. FSL R5-0912]AIQ38846.1 hypothetical protein R50912_01350 [Paenibacillus sp. FSL R5-0912]